MKLAADTENGECKIEGVEGQEEEEEEEEEEEKSASPKSENEKFDAGFAATHFVLDNIYVVAPLTFIGSLAIGVVFYMLANGWDFALAYYYAASVLLGPLYLVPSEPNPISPVFTQWYYLWGTTLLMGAIAAMANEMLNNASRVAAEERKRIILSLDAGRQDEEGEIEHLLSSFSDRVAYHRDWFLDSIGWTAHRTRYTVVALAVLCYGVGVAYGIYFEGWTLSRAAFFSLSAMSASGTSPPICDHGDAETCRLGTLRSLLVGTYLLFAVPIFTYAMGQFAEILVERAIRTRERMLMTRPLTDGEFRFAIALQGGLRGGAMCPSDTDAEISLGRVDSFAQEVRLDLGDFIVLELLRLKKISKHDLDYIKDLFDMLDSDGDGVLIRPAVSSRRPFASCDELDRRTVELLEARSQRSRSRSRSRSFLPAVLSPLAPRSGSPSPGRRDSGCMPEVCGEGRQRTRQTSSWDARSPVGAPEGEDTFPATSSFPDLAGEEGEDGDEGPSGEEALGSISQGYNALVLPVMRQLSQPSSAKQHAERKSRLQHSSVLVGAVARLKAFSAAATRRRRSTTSSAEHVPLLATPKRHYSTPESLRSVSNEV